MCGLVGEVTDQRVERARLESALATLALRGPDGTSTWTSAEGNVWLGHRRLSIIDLSDAGLQPMASSDGRYQLVYNGEIYNYLELRAQLADYPFRTATDSEVLIAAWATWGPACLDRLRGMFAFALWDTQEKTLVLARDRFGVKPMYLHASPHGLVFASEIKALHAWGVRREPDDAAWLTYLATGVYDESARTFWRDIQALPAGHTLTWRAETGPQIARWYDPAAAVGLELDTRPEAEVIEELEALVTESIRLRFRSDVPVGLCLSGGLDSSILLAVTRRLHGTGAPIHTFTYLTGDPAYDELPWVEAALRGGGQIPHYAHLRADEVPALAAQVAASQDEPFGGIPTVAMAKVHALAAAEGVTVLLDGNGMDEGWAGYDYYRRAGQVDASIGPVQGTKSSAVRADCVRAELLRDMTRTAPPTPFGDPLRDLQYRDLTRAKIPRAMRFADRVSMMFSRELREPFLDHPLVELGLRQPAERKVRDGSGKWLVRQMARGLLPADLREAPKRAVQTPQREWLRGPLAPWVSEQIDRGLEGWGRRWLDVEAVRSAFAEFTTQGWDNSFPIWQWISIGLYTS